MKKNLLTVSLAIVGLMFGVASCTSNDSTTIVYPGSESYFKPLETLCGNDTVQDPSTGMFTSVYKALTNNTMVDYDQNIGIFPPNIEGAWKMDQYYCVYSTDINDQPFVDGQIVILPRTTTFSNQHNRLAAYSSKQGSGTQVSDTVYVMGKENKFAAWCEVKDEQSSGIYNWKNIMVCLYTGEIYTDADGNRSVKNPKYAFYIREMDFGYTLTHADSVALSSLNAVGTLKVYWEKDNMANEVFE